MAKRYFFDLVSDLCTTTDGDGILLSDPSAARRYGTRLLAEYVVANTGERDQRLILTVRDASGDMLFKLSMKLYLEVAPSYRHAGFR